VGGSLCSYFDPLSAADMLWATREMLARRHSEGVALSEQCRAHAAKFSWDTAAETILARLVGEVRKKVLF